MATLLAKRLLSLIPVLFVVSFIVSALVHVIPGDAALDLAGGANATPERIAEVRTELNLDKPFLRQYTDWVGNAVHGDFGRSFSSRQTVSSEIASKLPITLSLVLAASLLGLLFGAPVGLLAGIHPGTRLDRALIALTTLGIAIPSFWLASMLIVVFAIHWSVLPVLGYSKFSDSPIEWARHIALPAFALSLGVGASVARQLRAGVADAMESKYVKALWAKGATKREVIRHAAKNASIPAVTVFGFYLGSLLGGAVIMEQIFSIGGLGTFILQGVTARDIPVIQGVAIMFVLIYVSISLVLDIVYGYLDPRVRVS